MSAPQTEVFPQWVEAAFANAEAVWRSETDGPLDPARLLRLQKRYVTFHAARRRAEPDWLSRALNEGDGTYKP